MSTDAERAARKKVIRKLTATWIKNQDIKQKALLLLKLNQPLKNKKR